MTARENIALWLNKLRKERGYSVQELGALVGRSPKTISAWEVGRGQPDADMLVQLCEIYGLGSVGVLFGEPAALAGTISSQELELLNEYRKLNKDGTGLLFEYAVMLSKESKYRNSGFDVQ